MPRPDDSNPFKPKGSQRLVLLLVVLFCAGQFLNLLLQQLAIGSFRTNDLLDAWTLVVCIYAASIARCCIPRGRDDLDKGRQARFWSFISFLSVSSLATVGLAVLVGAAFSAGNLECTVVIGCACQVIALVALVTIGFGGGLIVGNKLMSFAVAIGLSFIGSGALVVHQSTSNLGVVLPSIVLLGMAARDIKQFSQT
jgi:hypothetical protein